MIQIRETAPELSSPASTKIDLNGTHRGMVLSCLAVSIIARVFYALLKPESLLLIIAETVMIRWQMNRMHVSRDMNIRSTGKPIKYQIIAESRKV